MIEERILSRRLIAQHHLYGSFTRQFLTAAGITAGMKVLDVGSGAGDVALLLVGPQGRVVGVDTNADILTVARARVRAAAGAPSPSGTATPRVGPGPELRRGRRPLGPDLCP